LNDEDQHAVLDAPHDDDYDSNHGYNHQGEISLGEVMVVDASATSKGMPSHHSDACGESFPHHESSLLPAPTTWLWKSILYHPCLSL
jgi:hypothetical protein